MNVSSFLSSSSLQNTVSTLTVFFRNPVMHPTGVCVLELLLQIKFSFLGITLPLLSSRQTSEYKLCVYCSSCLHSFMVFVGCFFCRWGMWRGLLRKCPATWRKWKQFTAPSCPLQTKTRVNVGLLTFRAHKLMFWLLASQSGWSGWRSTTMKWNLKKPNSINSHHCFYRYDWLCQKFFLVYLI